jgi:hypothetical protein
MLPTLPLYPILSYLSDKCRLKSSPRPPRHMVNPSGRPDLPFLGALNCSARRSLQHRANTNIVRALDRLSAKASSVSLLLSARLTRVKYPSCDVPSGLAELGDAAVEEPP